MKKPKALPRGKALETVEALYPPAAGDRERTGRHVVSHRSRIEFNPFQPRKKYPQAELDKLGQSIYQHGLIEPLVARETPGRPGWYQLIDGQGRYQSTEPRTGFNGVEHLDLMVREATDEEMGDVAFVANLRRLQHTPSEEVARVKKMVARGLNAAQIRELTGESPDWVQKRIALGRNLGDDVLPILDYKESVTFAEETNKLTGRLRSKVIKFVLSRADEKTGTLDLSVREFRQFVEMHGGQIRALRTTPAPSSGSARPLPQSSVNGDAPAQLGYEWEEDEPRGGGSPAPSYPAPDVNASAVPATASRIQRDAQLLVAYLKQFGEADTWSERERDEMTASIEEAAHALEEARELLLTATD